MMAVVLVLAAGLRAPQSFAQTAAPNAASGSDYKANVVVDLEDMGKKLLDLAQAIPPDKYTWRPSGEVAPALSELFVFAATQYYQLPSDWGLVKAMGYEADGDEVTFNRAPSLPLEKTAKDKTAVVNELLDAVSYFSGIVKTLSDDDLQKTIKVRGRTTTTYASLVTMDGDIHEYLAQAIVYARINGIVLPWMAERQQAQVERGWRTEVTRVKQTN